MVLHDWARRCQTCLPEDSPLLYFPMKKLLAALAVANILLAVFLWYPRGFPSPAEVEDPQPVSTTPAARTVPTELHSDPFLAVPPTEQPASTEESAAPAASTRDWTRTQVIQYYKQEFQKLLPTNDLEYQYHYAQALMMFSLLETLTLQGRAIPYPEGVQPMVSVTDPNERVTYHNYHILRFQADEFPEWDGYWKALDRYRNEGLTRGMTEEMIRSGKRSPKPVNLADYRIPEEVANELLRRADEVIVLLEGR